MEDIKELITQAMSDAYHGGWRKSKKHQKRTNLLGVNRSQTEMHFRDWLEEYLRKNECKATK